MLCTGCGTESVDSNLSCGGCAKEVAHETPPAVFQVGQAMQRQAAPDRNKRGKRAQRIWSHAAMACTVIMIIFVIGNQ